MVISLANFSDNHSHSMSTVAIGTIRKLAAVALAEAMLTARQTSSALTPIGHNTFH